MTIRIEVRNQKPLSNPSVLTNAQALGIHSLTDCQTVRVYFLAAPLSTAQIEQLCRLLLVDPVTEIGQWWDLTATPRATASHGEASIEVAFRPGVTDIPARELARGMVEIGLPAGAVATAKRYELRGDLSEADLRKVASGLLCNETVEHYSLGPINPQFGQEAAASDRVEQIPLAGLDDDALLKLSRARLLSLDRAEMRAIQEFYEEIQRQPTDVELETLAQTWSEHCVHKTFRAQIDFIWQDANGQVKQQIPVDGLLKQYIRAATEAVNPAWLRSAFVDNAGIIAFDDHYDLAFKVETHNHPSALEPFGGANTGVGGVVRDIIGVSARPIATTDILCFGPQDYPYDQLPTGILHPQRIADGVVAGIGDYGNKLGLPTVNGAIVYDEGYLGNPLVFCGCVGLLPHGRHPTAPQAGDLVVALGGRTGRDGIHGATFSSAELTHDTSETAGSAVQIGDPITEKGLIELIEAARDEGLYTAITDCGAGGFSSAVGEMGKELGAEIELTNVKLKYPGLTPWEIWLSEAQERMVLAVPPTHLPQLQALADRWDVEVSVLGHFTGDQQLRVRYNQQVVADLPMHFLHDGLPRRQLQAVYREAEDGELATGDGGLATQDKAGEALLALLAHPSIASKEAVIRRYDHEVRGGTLVRPLTGPQMDGPSDAAVLKPMGTWHHAKAFALSAAINPLLGKRDPYAMAVSAVDEAFRNLVAVGTDPDQVAILDNFCWGNPTLPDRLGALVRTCQGCYDAAVAYRSPFISGKDSLYNEFNGKPIPSTLLISAIGIVPDMAHCVTSHLKSPGNRLYLLGETQAELGGSLLYTHWENSGGTAPTMPAQPLVRYRLLHQAIQQGWIRACHDLSEGGLALALAEMALAGRRGATVTLDPMQAASPTLDPLTLLFSESNGRLLVEVQPENMAAFEAHMAGVTLLPLGEVTAEQTLQITHSGQAIVSLAVTQLVDAWKGQA
ncbi:MAG: phosphoribosylformylglycinamidine synthase subunit PurL [Caldilineaceae bacterium]|nr:phosphoribosylformylglycinamidine synthase subunit PurL [Caldilineaceae bacterium]